MKEIAVLHVDPDPGWRGGQQQAFYLHQGMLARGLKSGFVCNPGSELAQRLERGSLACYPIRHRFEADLFAAIRLACYARKAGYNVLHLHSSHALSWGIMAKLFYPSLKLVASRRVDFHISGNLLSRFKYCSGMLNAVVAISENIHKVLLEDGIPEAKIRLIYSGVDIHKYDQSEVSPKYRNQWQIDDSAIIVGTVAAFVAHKDYRNFVTAAAIALRSNPSLHFVAVGDGVQKAMIEELAKELGISDKISFTGFQSNVGAHLKAFDIFVMASKKEGLGTSVLDAMSVGLAVIGTRAGGIAEMIEDGKSGLVVDARNSEALAGAILRLANDKELRATLGRGALSRVCDFDKEHMVDSNIRLYQSLL
jgi:glycosyltransferase involved in cell wall biosynthesis